MKRRGLTLVEVVVSTAITAVMLLLLGQVLHGNANATRFDLATTEAGAGARKAIRRLAEELANSGADDTAAHVTPNRTDGTTTPVQVITFQPRIGVTGDAVADWGTSITYQLQDSPGEIPGNGLDDDRDGVTDERALVRISGAITIAIDHGVTAFEIERAPNTDAIQIRITVARGYGLSTDAIPVTRTISTTIRVRNRPTPAS